MDPLLTLIEAMVGPRCGQKASFLSLFLPPSMELFSHWSRPTLANLLLFGFLILVNVSLLSVPLSSHIVEIKPHGQLQPNTSFSTPPSSYPSRYGTVADRSWIHL